MSKNLYLYDGFSGKFEKVKGPMNAIRELLIIDGYGSIYEEQEDGSKKLVCEFDNVQYGMENFEWEKKRPFFYGKKDIKIMTLYGWYDYKTGKGKYKI